MKKIRKILEYDLSSSEIEALYSCGIVNGCGGSAKKGGTDFNETIERNIELIPGFDKRHKHRLFEEIKLICIEHDIDFRFKKGFYYSNYKFSKKIYLLLKRWAGRGKAFGIAGIAFILLSKHGKKFYK